MFLYRLQFWVICAGQCETLKASSSKSCVQLFLYENGALFYSYLVCRFVFSQGQGTRREMNQNGFFVIWQYSNFALAWDFWPSGNMGLYVMFGANGTIFNDCPGIDARHSYIFHEDGHGNIQAIAMQKHVLTNFASKMSFCIKIFCVLVCVCACVCVILSFKQ